jgi:hypothetical protein
MSIPSNLYAEKIFSEHPECLWAMDEKVDYISLIQENKRNILNWSVYVDDVELTTEFANHVSEYSGSIVSPFSDSITNKIIGQIPTTSTVGQIKCVSEDIINFQDLSEDMSNFAIGLYLYSIGPYIKSVEVGYEYFDTITGTNVQNLKTYDFDLTQEWGFFSVTSDIPPDNTTLRLVLKINYADGGSEDSSYSFLVNGISFGQWSEEFNATSLGVSPQLTSSTIAMTPCEAIPAYAYAREDNFGYYLVSEKKLLSKNSGIPMVFGASNITTLYPSQTNGSPSFIIPGNGFLNNSGKYKEHTFEAWIRINSDAIVAKRIFGPIASEDGLYVEGPFLKLKINSNIGSYFVGEWTRPMLIHIRVANNNASLLINGEEVIKLDFITDNLVFPSKFNSNEKDQDWLAFYCYDDVTPVELDCIAIYSYQVPQVLAKRRFAYGQAVEFPESVNIAYSGESVYMDYPFANYANNYSYPNIGKWEQGVVENLVVENNTISTPQYNLPEVILSSGSLSELYTDCLNAQEGDKLFFTLRPNAEWDSVNGYLFFNNLNITNEDFKNISGCFKINQDDLSKQVLLKLESKNNINNSFSIYFETNKICYSFTSGGSSEIIIEQDHTDLSNFAFVSIDFDKLSEQFSGPLSNFLSNKNDLKLYIGGSPDLLNTFSGKIYKVWFSSSRNFTKIDQYFNNSGIPIDSFVSLESLPETFFDHLSTYTLLPSNQLGVFSLDIGINGYWEDYIPLQHFAKYILDSQGNPKYDLDFLQFNINYPSPSRYVQTVNTSDWSYSELKQAYSSPIARDYSDLDNSLFTGYANYEDLRLRSVNTYDYDTSKSSVRSFISFQNIVTGANYPDGYFLYTLNPPKNGVVEPSEGWQKTKYEVVDNMIIYLPPEVDFSELAVVTHLEFNLASTVINKVNIKSLQLASQALNETEASAVGTRFGTKLYPYRKSGFYYNYKDKNPFTIYKGSSPYLYLTKDSGISLKGQVDPLVNRGLSIPINKSLDENYKMIAMQVALRYDKDFFPYTAIPIFEIEAKDSTVVLYMVATDSSGQRARIYATDTRSGSVYSSVTFYLNGQVVRDPVITIKEWAFLGISFPQTLDFKRTQGSISLYPPLTFNTMSYYLSNSLQETQKITNRPWIKVLGTDPNELDWQFWDSNYFWRGVLVLATGSYYGVTPEEIFKNYTGTNKIIVDGGESLSLEDYEYNFYKDIVWQQTTNTAL